MKYPRLPLHLLTILALLFYHSSQAETVSILDFGAKAGVETDSTPAFVKALEYAKAHPGCTIEIPKGQFHLKTTSDPASIKHPARFHLRASGLKNVTLKGRGESSEIFFGQYAGGIMLEKCAGLAIRNLAFDYEIPLYSQGQVLGYSGSDHALTLKPDAGYPLPLNSPETIFDNPRACWVTLHKAKGMQLAFNQLLYSENTREEDGNVRYVMNDQIGNCREFITLMGSQNPAEALAGVRYVRVARAAGQLLRLNFCSGITVENVSVYAASGFTMLAFMSHDATVRGCVIKPRPGSDRMISTCADGFHFIGGKGKFLIENNSFDALHDDNINIILRGNMVESSPAPNVLKLETAFDRYYAVGDMVRVCDCVNSKSAEYKIVAVDASPRGITIPIHYTLTLDRPIAGPLVFASQVKSALPTLVYNVSWDFGDVTIRNNKCLNNFARGVRIAASGVTVENNSFDLGSYPSVFVHSSIRDGLVDEGLSFASNITIRNNTLVRSQNNGGASRNQGAICAEVRDFGTHQLAEGCRFLENIAITGNRISDSGKAGIACSNTRNLTIENNVIQNPNQLSKTGEQAGILVRNAANVTVKNNTVTGANVGQPVMLDQVIEDPNK